MDHNGKVITEMDVKQVLKNYSYAEKLKEESKILKKQSDVIKKILKQIEVFETNVNIENTTDFLDKIFDSYSKSLFKVWFFKEVITALSMFLRWEETDDKSYKQEMNILNEKWKKLSSQSIELEQRYRSYIYTFPIIVASDYVTAKEYAKLLWENFWDRLNKMQTEVLPIEERLRRNVNVLSNAISKWMF